MSGLSKRRSLSVPPDIFVDIILEMEKKKRPRTGKLCLHANVVKREKHLTNASDQTTNHRVLTDVYLSEKKVFCLAAILLASTCTCAVYRHYLKIRIIFVH